LEGLNVPVPLLVHCYHTNQSDLYINTALDRLQELAPCS